MTTYAMQQQQQQYVSQKNLTLKICKSHILLETSICSSRATIGATQRGNGYWKKSNALLVDFLLPFFSYFRLLICHLANMKWQTSSTINNHHYYPKTKITSRKELKSPMAKLKLYRNQDVLNMSDHQDQFMQIIINQLQLCWSSVIKRLKREQTIPGSKLIQSTLCFHLAPVHTVQRPKDPEDNTKRDPQAH